MSDDRQIFAMLLVLAALVAFAGGLTMFLLIETVQPRTNSTKADAQSVAHVVIPY